MEIQVSFQRKEPKFYTDRCAVDKAIELTGGEFSYFRSHLLEDYSFITENIDVMCQDKSGVKHCLLVLGEGQNDGILVESEGYGYARYSAYIPNARTLWQMTQYPALHTYCEQMAQLADQYAKQAVEGQQEGMYRIYVDDINRDGDIAFYNGDLLLELLAERPEIGYIECIDDEIFITVAPAYVQRDSGRNLRELTPQEVDVICAKHVLWLNDSGGEQADFSDCLIKDMNLSNRNLLNAIFDHAEIMNTSFRGAGLCFSTFAGTRFINCDGTGMVAEECECSDAVFISCKLDQTIFTHSNLSRAVFQNCTMQGGNIMNCCCEDTDFGNLDRYVIGTAGVSYNEQEWTGDDSPNLSM